MSPNAIFLLGPTASGKTALALKLADRFPVEIVSVDSALVYRGMNIGTAKPDAGILARYPHHLINLIEPTDAYSAARFCVDGRAAMEDISARGNVPLLVGGTMLYASALLNGLSDLPEADPAVRAALAARAAMVGWAAMHQDLARVDPESAKRLKPADAQRIQRALEVFQITGMPISSLQQRVGKPVDFPFRALKIGLVPSEREVLHERIAARFDAMLARGLIDEVRSLRARHALTRDMPSMRAVGYRQAWQFLDGVIDEKSMRETGIIATRQLAKRQMTWLRSMPDFEHVDCLRSAWEAPIIERCAEFMAQ